MEKCIEIIQRLLKNLFTGKIILHCHEGVIKKITKEEIVEKY